MAGPEAAVTATKVTPPRPPSRYLRRGRLIDLIDGSVDAGRGVVLVSAPAGSGKSTLINGWLDGRDRPGRLVADRRGRQRPVALLDLRRRGAATSRSRICPNRCVRAQGDGLDAVVDARRERDRARRRRGRPRDRRLPPRHQPRRPPTASNASSRSDRRTSSSWCRHGSIHRSVSADSASATSSPRSAPTTSGSTPTKRAGSSTPRPPGCDRAVDRLHERTEGWAAGLVLAGLSLRDERRHRRLRRRRSTATTNSSPTT